MVGGVEPARRIPLPGCCWITTLTAFYSPVRWYENGKLAEEMPMRDGKIEGLGRSWYESGFLKTELKIHDGEVVESKTWPDGQKPGDSR
jgi:hypothetical protein